MVSRGVSIRTVHSCQTTSSGNLFHDTASSLVVTLRNSVSVVTHMGLGRGLRHLSSVIFSFDASMQKTMSTDIDARTLRGVRADQAMSCFGARLARGSVGSGHGRVVAKQVLSLDDFISHDWRTHHRAKFLSLCILFNARAAALGGLFVGVIASVLELHVLHWPGQLLTLEYSVGGQERSHVSVVSAFIVCPAVFWFLLFFWQRVCSILCWHRVVFFDKLCIDQLDEERKNRGILALAGFLKHSRRIKVLWGQQYLSRLWCTYELASWIHLNKAIHAVDFMPVAFAEALLHYALFMTSAVLVWEVCDYQWSDAWGHVMSFVCLAHLQAMPVHAVRRLMLDLSLLPQQVAEFSVRETKCFCCEVDHVHPDTGVPLPCDRELVYSTLFVWFGDGSDECHLDKFDELARASLQRLIRSVRGDGLQYSHALFLASPSLWQTAIRAASTASVDVDEHVVRYLADYAVFNFVVLPSCIALSFKGLALSARTIGTFQGSLSLKALDVCVSFALSVSSLLLWYAFLMPVRLSRQYASNDAQVVASVISSLCAVIIFSNPFQLLTTVFFAKSGELTGHTRAGTGRPTTMESGSFDSDGTPKHRDVAKRIGADALSRDSCVLKNASSFEAFCCVGESSVTGAPSVSPAEFQDHHRVLSDDADVWCQPWFCCSPEPPPEVLPEPCALLRTDSDLDMSVTTCQPWCCCTSTGGPKASVA